MGESFHAAAEFPGRQHAQVQTLFGNVPEPGHDNGRWPDADQF